MIELAICILIIVGWNSHVKRTTKTPEERYNLIGPKK